MVGFTCFLARRVYRLLTMTGLLVLVSIHPATHASLSLQETTFTYRPEAHPFYLETLQVLRNKNSGHLHPNEERQAYEAAYNSVKGTDIELDAWIDKSQAAPLMFQVQTTIKNKGIDPSRETPIRIELMALLGQVSRESESFLVDEEHIRHTAKWVCFQVQRGSIPMLAKNERYRFTSSPIAFGTYLSQLKNQFPIALKAVVTLENQAKEVIEIPVYPATFTGNNTPL